MSEKILVIEDDIKIARFIELELTHEGYSVICENDGRSGLARAMEEVVDLVILDVMLPTLNGMEVLRRLRQNGDTPVIMLTAKDDVTDKVMGLDLGADDYMTKPFAIEELLARIRRMLKRKDTAAKRSPALAVGGLRLDPDQHVIRYQEDLIELTKREYDLLKYLMENKNIVLSREKILEAVWGYEFQGDTNVIDVYIRYLRCKIDDRYGTQYIHTVRGVGYVLKHEQK